MLRQNQENMCILCYIIPEGRTGWLFWGFFFLFNFMCVVGLPACVCVPSACNAKGGQKTALDSPCNWSYRHLLAAMWTLGTKPGSSVRVTSACNHWATSPGPYHFLKAQLPIPLEHLTLRGRCKTIAWSFHEDSRELPHFFSGTGGIAKKLA